MREPYKYNAAYSKVYGDYVEIIGVHYDSNEEAILTAKVQDIDVEKEVLFRENELTHYYNVP